MVSLELPAWIEKYLELLGVEHGKSGVWGRECQKSPTPSRAGGFLKMAAKSKCPILWHANMHILVR